MWNDEKRKRLQALRSTANPEGLNESEQREISALVLELESEEVELLRPATDRVRDERMAIEAQNRVLEELLRRFGSQCRRRTERLSENRTALI